MTIITIKAKWLKTRKGQRKIETLLACGAALVVLR